MYQTIAQTLRLPPLLFLPETDRGVHKLQIYCADRIMDEPSSSSVPIIGNERFRCRLGQETVTLLICLNGIRETMPFPEVFGRRIAADAGQGSVVLSFQCDKCVCLKKKRASDLALFSESRGIPTLRYTVDQRAHNFSKSHNCQPLLVHLPRPVCKS